MVYGGIECSAVVLGSIGRSEAVCGGLERSGVLSGGTGRYVVVLGGLWLSESSGVACSGRGQRAVVFAVVLNGVG